MNIACYYGQGYITLTVSESVFGGTVCGKAARTGLWGSGELTNRSITRFFFCDYFSRERNYISEWEVSQMGRGWSAAGVPNTDFTDHTQICGGSKRMITD